MHDARSRNPLIPTGLRLIFSDRVVASFPVHRQNETADIMNPCPLRRLPASLPILAFFLSIVALTGRVAGEETRPNVVVVFIDDMGWADVSCFGGEVVETENIDRLAAEGIKFTNFYVNSPICSPSRVALTT